MSRVKNLLKILGCEIRSEMEYFIYFDHFFLELYEKAPC